MLALLSFSAFFLLWVILSGLFDAFHLGLGVLSCLFVTILNWKLMYGENPPPPNKIFKFLFRLPAYFLWLLKEIALANWHVLYLALFPSGMQQVEPAIISFRTQLKSDFARYLLANSITLTPGTVTIKMDEDELIVHSISRKTTVSLEGDMERRIAWLFDQSLEGKKQ